MLLKTEIEKFRDSLFTTCSEKEKLFYHFMTQQPYSGSIEMPTGDLDRICFAVFTNSNDDVSKEVQRVAPSEPFKHIHYSNSIVTLIPVCLKSIEAKNKYLKQYFRSHSLPEKLLLTQIFPSENFEFFANPKTSLEKLIDETFYHPKIPDAEKYFPSAFLEVNDVVGLLAFRAAYLELVKIHPNTKIENQYSQLSTEVRKLIAVVTKRIDLMIDILAFAFLLLASPLTVYEINKYYTELKVDKLSSIWTFVSPLLMALLFVSKRLFPKIFSFYDDFKHWLIVFWFSFRKVNYNKLLQLSKTQ